MRMWMVDPKILCQQHLLGEHVETHMFVGTIKNGYSVQGYLDNNLLDISQLAQRHEDLAAEMTSRGMNHQSPLPSIPTGRNIPVTPIDVDAALAELLRRCPECVERHRKLYGS